MKLTTRAGRLFATCAVFLWLAACSDRDTMLRADVRAANAASVNAAPMLDSTSGVIPGIHPAIVLGAVQNPYAGNPAAAEDGRRLFVDYNCAGCHGGRAGGGMGPSLRDSLWLYGSSDPQLLSTIIEGRPAGMPAWGAKIPRDQLWRIITYIRTMGTPNEPDAPPPPANPGP